MLTHKLNSHTLHTPKESAEEQPTIGGRNLHFVWLEITGQCNLQCTHCYAESAPTGTHGTLTVEEWKRVIVGAKQLGADVVQFIGGEPTLHPHFAELVRFAVVTGVGVEVYTNLVRVPDWMWTLFEDCKVSLATSFYSADPGIHDQVTTRKGSQQKTLANIKEALSRSLPVRVGLIKVFPDQDMKHTEQMLRSLGITEVGVDNVRGIGRGAQHSKPNRPVDALCGQCASHKAAVDPHGKVYPCVFSRWLEVGNVHNDDFSDIVTGASMRTVREHLEVDFSSRPTTREDCNPMCSPRGGCNPTCPPSCSPTCNPSAKPGGCWPDYGNHDTHRVDLSTDIGQERTRDSEMPELKAPCLPGASGPCIPEVYPCSPQQLCSPNVKGPCIPDASPCSPQVLCRPNIG